MSMSTKRSVYHRCRYRNCNNGFHNGYKLFRFPHVVERQKLWIENCGNEKLAAWAPSSIRCSGLCQDHFVDEDFMDDSKKSMRRNRIPIHWRDVDELKKASIKSSNSENQIDLDNILSKDKQHVVLQQPSSTFKLIEKQTDDITDKMTDNAASMKNQITLSSLMPKDKQYILVKSSLLKSKLGREAINNSVNKLIDKSVDRPKCLVTVKSLDKLLDKSKILPTITLINKPKVTSTNKPLVKLMVKPIAALKSTEKVKSIVTSIDKPIITLTDEPIVTLTDKPIITLTDKPIITLTDKPSVTLPNESTVTWADKPSIKSSDKPIATLTDKPSVTLSNESTVTWADKTSIKSSDKPIVTLTDMPIITVMDKPSTALADKQINESIDKVTVEPIYEQIVSPTNKSIVELTTKPENKSTVISTDKPKLQPVNKLIVKPVFKLTEKPTVQPENTENGKKFTKLVYVRVPTQSLKSVTPASNVEMVDAAVCTRDLKFITSLHNSKGESPQDKAIQVDIPYNVPVSKKNPDPPSPAQAGGFSAKASMYTYQAKLLKMNAKLQKLRRQIKTEKTKTGRMQKRIDNLKLLKFDLDTYLENNDVSEFAKTMIKLQLHRYNTSFTKDEKDLAKMIYHQSIPLYSRLRRAGLVLPGESTVRNEIAQET